MLQLELVPLRGENISNHALKQDLGTSKGFFLNFLTSPPPRPFDMGVLPPEKMGEDQTLALLCFAPTKG